MSSQAAVLMLSVTVAMILIVVGYTAALGYRMRTRGFDDPEVAVWPAAASLDALATVMLLAAALFVWPAFLGLYATMGGLLPPLTAATVAQPAWMQVLVALLIGPCLLFGLRALVRDRDTIWLMLPALLGVGWLGILSAAALAPFFQTFSI